MKQLRPVIIHNMSENYKMNGKNEKKINLTRERCRKRENYKLFTVNIFNCTFSAPVGAPF